MPTVNELYKEHEQLKRDGKNEEAIAKLEELLKQDEKHVLAHLALSVLYRQSRKARPGRAPRREGRRDRAARHVQLDRPQHDLSKGLRSHPRPAIHLPRRRRQAAGRPDAVAEVDYPLEASYAVSIRSPSSPIRYSTIRSSHALPRCLAM